MPWVAGKTMTVNGRQVHPGDLLPEVAGWGATKTESRAKSGRIKWVDSVAAVTEPPPEPAQAEPRTPTPGAGVGPGTGQPRPADPIPVEVVPPHADSKSKGKGNKQRKS